MKAYYLAFSYPDGHVEEIEEVFSSLNGAVDYGMNLLNQVQATEVQKKGSSTAGKHAYFTVLEDEGGSKKIIYTSHKE